MLGRQDNAGQSPFPFCFFFFFRLVPESFFARTVLLRIYSTPEIHTVSRSRYHPLHSLFTTRLRSPCLSVLYSANYRHLSSRTHILITNRFLQ